MRAYSQSELDELVNCPKVIASPPRKEMKLDGGHRRNDMEVRSKDGKVKFTVFMRINEMLQENFSVGLVYHPTDEPVTICLLRCNGQHGLHKNRVINDAQFDGFHIHQATEEAIAADLAPEQYAELTTEYASYQQGLAHLVKIANITDTEKYFPDLGQTSLWLMEPI